MAVNWLDVFPHTCKVYRITGQDELTLDSGSVSVIYEGPCRDEGNSAMRTYQTEGVMKSDHSLQIPELLIGVTNECFIDIKNDCVDLKRVTITNCQPFRFGRDRKTNRPRVGTTIMYNEAKN